MFETVGGPEHPAACLMRNKFHYLAGYNPYVFLPSKVFFYGDQLVTVRTASTD
jgi:hypothetical protein